MASDVVVPEVGELGMDVTFVRWLKAAGEAVAVGDPLFEVDTDKSVMVVEAYAAGTLVDLRASEGDIVTPRQVIGRILAPGEPAAGSAAIEHSGPAALPRPPAPGEPSATLDLPAPADRSTGASTAQLRASPRARRVAAELGVELGSFAGSGPDGLITEADVQAAAASGRATSGAVAATPATPPPSASATAWSAKVVDRASRARRATAELTAASWRTIPHFYLELEAELEAGLALARPTPLVCAAAARALLRHPECNLEWSGDRLVPRQRVDLGLLVDTPDGLLISVVRDAADLDLAAMAEAVTAASDRARAGILGPADLGTRSLTVSNLGMHPVDRFSAVIPAPDILALAVGRVRTVARWQGSSFEPRRVVSLTLSVDHRALDGSAAARLLADLEALLRDPASEGLA